MSDDLRLERLQKRRAEWEAWWDKYETNKIDFAAGHRADLERAEELEVTRALQRKIIAVGYKTLAAGLHPDIGGSTLQMARLNRARDELKKTVRR
jgi:hypothetical protein